VLKLVRDLQRRKARERRELVLLEGRRLVEDARDAGAELVAALAADDADCADLLDRLGEAGAALERVERREFDALAGTDTPDGVLAVARWSPRTLADLPAPGPRGVLLVIDAVQDPGNVGTMIRTAHALGAAATVALDGTADVRGPKVLRGAMGAHFRHPVAEATFDEFTAYASGRVALLVAAMDGAPASGPAAGASALVVGSEGQGVRAGWRNLPATRVAIPMRDGAESLNAAVAAGILLYELTRGA